MGYIGPSPNPGQNREVDDISSSFNGSLADFTLQVNSQNVSPGSSNAIIVSLGGVVQNPGTDYTVAASTLTFTTAPASGLAFFGLVLGQQVDTEGFADGGTLSNPVITGDLSIADKIVHTGDTNNAIRFPASDTITAETAGSERVRVNSSGQVGIGTASPTVNVQVQSGSANSLLKLAGTTAGSGINDGLDVGINGSDGILWNRESGAIQIATNNAERVRIDASGNVGIGNTNPGSFHSSGERLVVGSGAGEQGMMIYSASDGNGVINFGHGTSGSASYEGRIIYEHATEAMKFHAGAGTERMRLRTSTGGLMINDTGSTRIGEPRLHVLQGGASTNVASFFFNTTDDRDALIIRHNGCGTQSSGMIKFLNEAGNENGRISGNTNSITYATSSDYRLKENEVSISDGITRLKTLKPYRFNFKDAPAKTVDGFFAHEVTAVPEAITGTKDQTEDVLYKDDDELPSGKNIGDVKETVPKYQGIDQSKLVPLLTAALQEAITKIETLETKVAALEAA